MKRIPVKQMNKTIEIDVFDIKSIKDAVKDLNAFSKRIVEGSREITRRMAEVCADTARAAYGNGEDGNDSFSVDVYEEKDGHVVSASGQDVYFLEFGAGVAAGSGYDTTVIEPPVDISPGSWSSTRGTKEFSRYGSWHHKGEKYTEIVPRKGMYYGVKAATEQLEQIAEEVFRND